MIKKDPDHAADGPVDDRRSRALADRITRSVVEHVESLAESCQAAAIFVYADALRGAELPLPDPWRRKTFYVIRTGKRQRADEQHGRQVIRVPDVPLTRMGQVRVALFLALANQQIRVGDTLVCLAGLAGTGSLDTVLIMEAREELESLATGQSRGGLPGDIQAGVLERVLNLASELGYEGREGKPVGALFVVGDYQRVLPMTRPLILNPFAGHPEEARNILDPALDETIKELTSIDGAFLIRGDGVIESCGTYINVSMPDEAKLPPGLGARHQAAAAITATSSAIAITVSESSGSILVFRHGRTITEIEKPRSSAAREVRSTS